MIKFFRKIRYDLMEKNKTKRYFKYAIGEIVLVVIGILIALSINNWNENRLSKELSMEFHQRIADELGAVIKRSESEEKRAKVLVEYIRKTVVILKNGELTTPKKDTLNYTLQNFFQFVRIEGELKTFQEMESTGQLGLFYNKELKNHILQYLTQLEAISKMFDQMASQVNSTEFIDKYVTIQIVPETIHSNLEYNFEDLAKDTYVINKMSRYGYLWQTKQYFSKILTKTTLKLKEAIEEELK